MPPAQAYTPGEVARYFAYGSNLSTARLNRRVQGATPIGSGALAEHRLVFNKRGKDGSAKANIEVAPGEQVWGVVYELPAGGLSTLDEYEGGYRRIAVTVAMSDGGSCACQTYLSDQVREELSVRDSYAELVVSGAAEHALPEAYRAEIERAARRRRTPD